MKKLAAALILVLGMAASAQAIPELQLDILGGTYNSSTTSTIPTPETILAPSNAFTLYAYLIPGANVLDDTYFLSAAVIPIQTQTTPAPAIGSFSVNGISYNVTGDMIYGVPPIETLATTVNAVKDSGDLGTHSVFETYFREFSFQFGSDQITPYNTQDRAKAGDPIPTTGTGMYYAAFNVDISSLTEGYGIHFDLYNSELAKKDPLNIDVSDFAPFSHDAEGWWQDEGGGPPQEVPVPEPGTVMLLGTGLIGLALYGRRRMK